LLNRWPVGRPIAVLDLVAVAPTRLLWELDNLEEFTGLEVKCEAIVNKYMCDGETPEQFRFEEQPGWENDGNEDLEISWDCNHHMQGWSGQI